ncbi:DUF771 domain-containing protein [Brevibacterium sp. JNUCC-42]|uniref:DUF771 domain-containing protein n=1 Tax=Brevibacillus laterosporus TaxID=1465 RepID=A0A502IDF6_BRELA|nr:DUF771 domain-containing protein [Brevibacillus laterosporus]QDX91422.1 DUF771 domain-containing protein [Brevibacillus laterosporus]QOS97922.1 DUF771 domain-containing protein [Brevibacterium sp. JNUCC-42]TPG84979.1 DUF771 domain-containing protein [Brevibacillus laterosporus]TPG89930.1 DUF771 domain-containing protein [Brevibacillus laterosporus]
MLTVQIDETYVKELTKLEIQKILKESRSGCWWDLKRLEMETCRKRDWLIEKILLNPKFKRDMATISNSKDSGRWMFKAEDMRVFLNKNFHYLNSSDKEA